MIGGSRLQVLAAYNQPRHYDVAFGSHRDSEVRFLNYCFKRYSRIQVRRIVDLGCGPGPHAIRLARAGYQVTALDVSRISLRYVAERARRNGVQINFTRQDMTNFRLDSPIDAAFCLQSGQAHILTNAAILRHLRAVARVLRRGGLYVFDRFLLSSWTNPARRWSWSRRRGRTIVRASFSALEDVNPVSQIFRERITLEAVEDGVRRVYRQKHLSRMVFPQELRALVELAGGFEFVRWFFGFKPHQFLQRSRHPFLMVVVLRKT